MSIAASWEPWLSKPGPSIADPSNTPPPATVSHRTAAAAAEAGRRIRAEISVQTASVKVTVLLLWTYGNDFYLL